MFWTNLLYFVWLCLDFLKYAFQDSLLDAQFYFSLYTSALDEICGSDRDKILWTTGRNLCISLPCNCSVYLIACALEASPSFQYTQTTLPALSKTRQRWRDSCTQQLKFCAFYVSVNVEFLLYGGEKDLWCATMWGE